MNTNDQERNPALAAALEYAARGWPVFPCGATKRPMTLHGHKDASVDTDEITGWWQRYPHALIGIATGDPSGLAVLDIDMKHGVNGERTLAELLAGNTLPTTPVTQTRSGGRHIYFRRPEGGFACTTGDKGRGIGVGLDWRCDGGLVIAPTPGTGYRWIVSCDECDLADIPAVLMPRAPKIVTSIKPVPTGEGLSPYAARALDSACQRIISAGLKLQESTLNGECFSIGTLAGAGAVPPDIAIHALLWAAHQMPSRDPRWPWTTEEINRKVARAFSDGVLRPRSASNG